MSDQKDLIPSRLGNSDQYLQKAKKAQEGVQEEKILEMKNHYESRLANVRSELLQKDREIYESKNEINLLSQRLNSETEKNRQIESENSCLKVNYENKIKDMSNVMRSNEDSQHNLTNKLKSTEAEQYKTLVEKKNEHDHAHLTISELNNIKDKLTYDCEDKRKYIVSLQRSKDDVTTGLNNEQLRNSQLEAENIDMKNNLNRVSEEKRQIQDLSQHEKNLFIDKTHALENAQSECKSELASTCVKQDNFKAETDLRLSKQENELYVRAKNIEDLSFHRNSLENQLNDQSNRRVKTEQVLDDCRRQLESKLLQAGNDNNILNAKVQELDANLLHKHELYVVTLRDKERVEKLFSEHKEEYQHTLCKKNAEIDDMKSNIIHLEAELNKTNNELKNKCVSYNILSENFDNLKNEYNRYKIDTTDQLNSLHCNLNELNAKYLITVAELNDTKKMKADLESKFQISIENAHIMESQLNSDKRILNEDLINARNTIMEREREINALTTDNRRIKDELDHLTALHNKTVQEDNFAINHLKSEKDNWISRHNDAERDFHIKERELKENQIEYSNYKSHTDHTITDLTNKIRCLELEISKLSDNLSEMNRKNVNLNNTLDQTRREKDSVQMELVEAKKNITSLEDRIRSDDQKFAKTNLTDIKVSLDDIKNRRHDFQKKLEEQVSNLNREINYFSSLEDIKMQEEKWNYFNEKVNEQAHHLEQYQRQIEMLNNQEIENRRTIGELSLNKSNVDHMGNELNALKQENEKLKSDLSVTKYGYVSGGSNDFLRVSGSPYK